MKLLEINIILCNNYSGGAVALVINIIEANWYGIEHKKKPNRKK